MNKQEKYTKSILSPIYTPSEVKPELNKLINQDKYNKFLAEIDKIEISVEEKQFLIMAASRHLKFNYSLIADYYSHASEEMKVIMRNLALVIIDLDCAIENGYTKLAKSIIEEYKKDYEA